MTPQRPPIIMSFGFPGQRSHSLNRRQPSSNIRPVSHNINFSSQWNQPPPAMMNVHHNGHNIMAPPELLQPTGISCYQYQGIQQQQYYLTTHQQFINGFHSSTAFQHQQQQRMKNGTDVMVHQQMQALKQTITCLTGPIKRTTIASNGGTTPAPPSSCMQRNQSIRMRCW